MQGTSPFKTGRIRGLAQGQRMSPESRAQLTRETSQRIAQVVGEAEPLADGEHAYLKQDDVDLIQRLAGYIAGLADAS